MRELTPPGLPKNYVAFFPEDWDKVSTDRPSDIGWAFWNAPREMAGSVAWTGEFRHGRFYAGETRDDSRFAEVQQRNAELDGYPVVVLTDDEVCDAVAWYVRRQGYTLAQCQDAGVEFSDLAEELRLPWRDSTATAMRDLISGTGAPQPWAVPYRTPAGRVCLIVHEGPAGGRKQPIHPEPGTVRVEYLTDEGQHSGEYGAEPYGDLVREGGR